MVKKIDCNWYQKTTAPGIILIFRSCAPLQHKIGVMQGSVYRIVKPNGDWQLSDVALKKNKEEWTEIQYPTELSSKIVNETLEKKVRKEKGYNKTTQ